MALSKVTSRATKSEEYERYRMQWEEGPQDPPFEKTAHPVLASRFVKELEYLASLVRRHGISSFDDALRDLRVCRLIDDAGVWQKTWTWSEPNPASTDDKFAMMQVLTQVSKRKRPEELAIAEAVALLALPGNSFPAACQRLKTLLDEHHPNRARLPRGRPRKAKL